MEIRRGGPCARPQCVWAETFLQVADSGNCGGPCARPQGVWAGLGVCVHPWALPTDDRPHRPESLWTGLGVCWGSLRSFQPTAKSRGAGASGSLLRAMCSHTWGRYPCAERFLSTTGKFFGRITAEAWASSQTHLRKWLRMTFGHVGIIWGAKH